MTKQELLDQLIGFDWVLLLNGNPELLDTIDLTNVYRQNIFENALDTGTYRWIYFYVYDEGGAGESALYKDRIPSPSIANADEIFRQEMENELQTQYPGIPFIITSADSSQETAIVRTFVDNAGNYNLIAFAVVRDAGVYSYTQIIVSDEIIANF